jgi:hypothetical protein
MKNNLIYRICEKIKKPVLVAISVATLAITPYISGCASPESKYRAWRNSLTPEQREKQDQADLATLMEMNENEKKKKERDLAMLMQMNEDEAIVRQQLQNNYPIKSQADRDADVIDYMNGRFGADMATTGFLKAVTDYSK